MRIRVTESTDEWTSEEIEQFIRTHQCELDNAITEYLDSTYTLSELFAIWKEDWYPKYHSIEDEERFEPFGGIENVTDPEQAGYDFWDLSNDLIFNDCLESELIDDAIDDYMYNHASDWE